MRSSARSLLVISFVEWAGAFQRPQHMAIGFARRGWDVTYVSPGYVHRRGRAPDCGLDLPANLRVVQPAVLPGGSRLGWIAAINEAAMVRALRGLRPAGAGPWDAVVFNDPRWARAAAALPARIRVFDAMDDLSAQAPDPAWAKAREREAVETARAVWTGTAMMAERLGGVSRPVTFIPCGVEGERFARPDPEAAGRAAKELAGLFRGAPEGPLAGYFGAINERIDPELPLALMEAGWRVLLIGPPNSKAPAFPPSNQLAMPGPKPYAELPGWLAAMDLALIPYRTSGANRFLYPVKALEYLAGGKPVLSTPLPDMKRFLSDYVLFGETVEDWRRAAANWPAIRDEAERKARAGRDYALGRTWDAMTEAMENTLAAAPSGTD